MGAQQSNHVRPSEKTCCGCFLSRHEPDTDTEMKFTAPGAPVGYWPHHEASAPTMMPYGPPGMQNGPGVMMVPPAGPLPRPPCAFDTHDTTRAPITAAVHNQHIIGQPTAPQTTQIDLRPRMRVLSVGGDSLEESLLFALTKEDKMAELTREVNEHVLNRPLPTEAYGGDVIIESTRPEGRT
uniref:Uncharacterized protein n=1 Tax=Vitrella brassicaformis TaxID=1169539 RepID=A0A7S1JMQ9_9ALVE|mmetsp:Transcript_16183/g.38718  ORF Transcript_16183/g.38718 Transcript_16183/m.38718 type:complete len:182 (+) Transcript_16183:403-948(+)